MKKITLESVTGERPADREFRPAPVQESIMPVKEQTLEDIMDDAANKATHAVGSCFILAALFVINASIMAADALPIAFIAAEAESLPSLILMAVVMTVCGYFGLKRSRTAIAVAGVLYGIQSLWIAYILYTYGATIMDGASVYWLLTRSLVIRGLFLYALFRGFDGLSTYHRLKDQLAPEVQPA